MAVRERTTQQKRAVLLAFENSGRPLTAVEAHEIAQSTCGSLGIATVYRAVKQLLAKGWLTEVSLPNSPKRYERKSLDHHHHFHCQKCDLIFDVSAPCNDLSRELPPGFDAHRHELTFYGFCPNCHTI